MANIVRRGTIRTIVPGRDEGLKRTTAGLVRPKRLLDGTLGVYDIFGRLRSLPVTLEDPIVRPEIRLAWSLPKPLGQANWKTSYDYAVQTLIRRNRELIATLPPTETSYSDRNPADGPNNYEICLQGLSQGDIENCGIPIQISADLTRPVPPPSDDELLPPGVRLSVAVVATAPGQVTVGIVWIVAGTPIAPGWTLSGEGAPSDVLPFETRRVDVIITESGTYTWSISGTFAEFPGTAADTATLEVVVGEIELPPLVADTATLAATVDDDGTVLLRTQAFDNAEYRWFRDGTLIATTTSPEYNDPGLDPGTYAYEVEITYDRTDPRTGEETRPSISATTSVTIAEDLPTFTLAINAVANIAIDLEAVYRGTNTDGTPATIPDDTRYLWFRDGNQIANTSEPEFTDRGSTPGVTHRYCVRVGALEACTSIGLAALSVTMSAAQQPRSVGDTQARVELMWAVAGGEPTGFTLTGAGITGERTLGASARRTQVMVDTPGEYDWRIVAAFSGGRTATATASINLASPIGLAPCPPVGVVINVGRQAVNVAGVNGISATWQPNLAAGCGVPTRYRVVFEYEQRRQFTAQFGVFEASFPLGSYSVRVTAESPANGFALTLGSISFDGSTGVSINETSVTFTDTVRRIDPGVVDLDTVNINAALVRRLTTANETISITMDDVEVDDEGNLTTTWTETIRTSTRGRNFGVSYDRAIASGTLTVVAINDAGESESVSRSRSIASRQEAAQFDLAMTFVRFDGQFAVFNLVLPAQLADTHPDGRAAFSIVYGWDYPDGSLRGFTRADADRYGFPSLDANGEARIPCPGGTVRYQYLMLWVTEAGGVPGAVEVSGLIAGQSNIVTVVCP